MNQCIIKYVNPKLLLPSNMAIVGSSGSLIGMNFGNCIDQFDSVVRFNRAPTKKFETIVGEKTTLRVVNSHVLCNIGFNKEELRDGYWNGQDMNFMVDLRNTNILHYGLGLSEHEEKIYSEFIHKSNKIFVFQFDQAGAPQGPPNCSSRYSVGVGFIHLCIKSDIKPNLFGFDIKPSNNRSHYWEKRPKAGKCHNVNNEKNVLIDLIKEGKVILHE